MSAIYQQLMASMKQAMKEKNKLKLSTIRMALAACKQKVIDEQVDLTNESVVEVLTKMIKQRSESVKQYEKANRFELAEREKAEIEVLQQFLPEPLTETEIITIIQQAIEASGSRSMKDMSKIMTYVKSKIKGRADMGKVGDLVKSQLN